MTCGQQAYFWDQSRKCKSDKNTQKWLLADHSDPLTWHYETWLEHQWPIEGCSQHMEEGKKKKKRNEERHQLVLFPRILFVLKCLCPAFVLFSRDLARLVPLNFCQWTLPKWSGLCCASAIVPLVCVMICGLRSVIMCCFVSRVKDPVLTLTCGAGILVLQFSSDGYCCAGYFYSPATLLVYLPLLQSESSVSTSAIQLEHVNMCTAWVNFCITIISIYNIQYFCHYCKIAG